MKTLDCIKDLRCTSVSHANIFITAFLGAALCAISNMAFAQAEPAQGLPVGNPISFQSAWQSTTDFNGPAKLAYDGNTDGTYSNGSVTHTSRNDTFQPSWTGDLGGVTEIVNIRVWNRTDSCCTSRLGNYYILVSDEPFQSDSLDVTLSDPNVFSSFRSNTSTTEDFDEFSVLRTGRFVRVQLQGDDEPLSLAEVEVFGNDELELPQYITPLAMMQSSTAFGAPAERALDRNIDGRFFAGSVTHTANTFQPYWTADLGSITDIAEIRIWNRTDCCTQRLANFYVMVSDVPFSTNSLDTELLDSDVASFFVPEIPAGSDSVTLDSNTFKGDTTGRYVRVQLQGTNPLSLAEVEVFGSVNANFEPDRTLAGSKFVSADELEIGENANGGLATGHWILSFGEDSTVTWFFSDVVVTGTYTQNSGSGTGMVADFPGGLQIAFEFDGTDLVWDSRQYLRTTERVDSQETLENFVDSLRFQTVEDFATGDTLPGGQPLLGKMSLQFDGNQVVWGVQDTLSIGTLIYDGRAGFRISFLGSENILRGFVLADGTLIFDFNVYEPVVQALPVQ